MQFFPYIYTLVKEGKEKGIPVARSLYFHYPNNINTLLIKDQFLLGDRVMVAPVLDSGATSRTVYFPAGNWYDFSSGLLVATGPATLSVSAPLDHLPVFVKEGSILPLYNQTHIETLVKNVAGINDFSYADSTMEFRFYGCVSDQLQLWDSANISMHYYTNDSLTTISGGPNRIYTSSFFHAASLSCFSGMQDLHAATDILVYPNPATTSVTVVMDESTNASGTIDIYSLSGLQVQHQSFNISSGNSSVMVDIAALADGAYLMKVSSNGKNVFIKIIKH